MKGKNMYSRFSVGKIDYTVIYPGGSGRCGGGGGGGVKFYFTAIFL